MYGMLEQACLCDHEPLQRSMTVSARRRCASGYPLYARAVKQLRLLGWSEAGSLVRIELLASRDEQKYTVTMWCHSLLALH